jgi:hypothetical protein
MVVICHLSSACFKKNYPPPKNPKNPKNAEGRGARAKAEIGKVESRKQKVEIGKAKANSRRRHRLWRVWMPLRGCSLIFIISFIPQKNK